MYSEQFCFRSQLYNNLNICDIAKAHYIVLLTCRDHRNCHPRSYCLTITCHLLSYSGDTEMANDAVQCFASSRPLEFIVRICAIYFFECLLLLQCNAAHVPILVQEISWISKIMKCNYYIMETWKISHIKQMPSPRARRQAIIWTNARILLICALGTYFNEILIEMDTFHSRKSIWKCRLENGGPFVSAPMCSHMALIDWA